MPEESAFLCGDWVWDPVLREMSHYPRRKGGHADEPDAVERLEPAKGVRLHRWAQEPIQTATGQVMPAQQARVVVEYEDGRTLDINEHDRNCAETIGRTLAEAYGVPLRREGAPTGRRGGNLPQRDSMGRLTNKQGRVATVLDESGGTLQIKRSKRLFGSERRELRTNEIRRLELKYAVKGPQETYAINAVLGAEEERVPIASYTGLEGWAEPGEWRELLEELGRRLGVEAKVDEAVG